MVLAPQAGARDSSSEVPAQPPWRLLSAARGSCAVGTAPLVLLSTWFLPPFRGAAAQSPWQPHCLCRAPSGRSRLHLPCRVLPRPCPSRPALKTSNSRPPSGSSAWQTPHHRWKLEKFLSYRPRDSPGVSALAAPRLAPGVSISASVPSGPHLPCVWCFLLGSPQKETMSCSTLRPLNT